MRPRLLRTGGGFYVGQQKQELGGGIRDAEANMGVSNVDVGLVTRICYQNKHRVCYGVLGAALSDRVGNPDAQPLNFGVATGGMVRACFGDPMPVASWVVAVKTGCPRGYGPPPPAPNPNFDPTWSTGSPLHKKVKEFLEWLDKVEPGWDANLQSTYEPPDVGGRA